MDMQSQLMQALEDKAGLDEATAERVAHVAMDFGKEHASELIAEHGPESVESAVPDESDGGKVTEAVGDAAERVSDTAGEISSAAEERVSDTAGDVGAAAEERVADTAGETGTAEQDSGGSSGGLGGLISRLTGH
jgi:hypothetical protein